MVILSEPQERLAMCRKAEEFTSRCIGGRLYNAVTVTQLVSSKLLFVYSARSIAKPPAPSARTIWRKTCFK